MSDRINREKIAEWRRVVKSLGERHGDDCMMSLNFSCAELLPLLALAEAVCDPAVRDALRKSINGLEDVSHGGGALAHYVNPEPKIAALRRVLALLPDNSDGR